MLNKYNSSLLLSDGLHPNDEGHKRLYKAISDFIETNI
jgi:lysophospholipase L1-like esterase